MDIIVREVAGCPPHLCPYSDGGAVYVVPICIQSYINIIISNPNEMLRRQPPAYSVQASCTDILLVPHSRPHFMTVSSHPICLI